MAKYRKKPVVIEASQWHENGDHPQDECEMLRTTSDDTPFMSEGQIVRYYRNPNDSGIRPCQTCSSLMHQHGWIDTLEGGHIVCPGDWIITGVNGEHYPCKPDIFEKTYEPVEDDGGK
jgi:hypothetical protein